MFHLHCLYYTMTIRPTFFTLSPGGAARQTFPRAGVTSPAHSSITTCGTEQCVLWCSKHGAQICKRVRALCAKRLLILLEQWTLSICMAQLFIVFPKDVKSQVERYGPIEVGSREEVATCPGVGEGTHCRWRGIRSRRGIHSWSTDRGRSKVCRHHSSWRWGHSCLCDCCAGWDKGITLCLGSTVRMQNVAHFPLLFNGCGPRIYRYTGLIPMACQFTDVAGMNSTIW